MVMLDKEIPIAPVSTALPALEIFHNHKHFNAGCRSPFPCLISKWLLSGLKAVKEDNRITDQILK